MAGGNAADIRTVFDAVTLTDTYAGNTSDGIEVRSWDKFTVLAWYAAGSQESGNTCEVEVSFSPDGSNYAEYGVWSNENPSVFLEKPFQIKQDKNRPISFESMGGMMRIRVKETGVTTNTGTLSLFLYTNKN